MTWVAAFTALASPSHRVILSLRWKYIAKGSWSQAKAAELAKLPPTRRANAMMCLVLMIVDLNSSILHRDHRRARRADDLLANDMTIWALDVAAAGEVIPEGFPLLHLTHEEIINVIARHGVIERSCQSLPGHGRRDETGSEAERRSTRRRLQ